MSAHASLLFLLHAHLPFVYHPSTSSFLEENWFFEAVAETYVPLIRMCERLAADRIRPALTISISPTLGAMLENAELKEKLMCYLQSRLELLEKEQQHARDNALLLKTIKMYKHLYSDAIDLLKNNDGSVLIPLQALQRAGQIEIITTSATHAVLPLLVKNEAVRAQIDVAADDYSTRFGRKPSGFWLPECAYEPSLNAYLKMAGFHYTFTEAHSLEGQENKAVFGVYAPYRTSNGINVFVRDAASSAEVWSAQNGYPGNPAYREFYRDLGFDADFEYIRPYLGEDGVRRNLGLKYYRITDRSKELSTRQYYDPDAALEQINKDAEDYIARRVKQAEDIFDKVADPLIVNCYDAELFGHWWFEGPAFLEAVIRKIRQSRKPLKFVTPSEYLEACRTPSEISPSVSSWGEKGFFDPWVNGTNDWIYGSLSAATDKMIDAANLFKTRTLKPVQKRALNQAAREILLAQSSDWAFLLYIGSHASYAKKRFINHVNAASDLLSQAIQNNVNENFLFELEKRDNIFPNIDFKLYASTARF